jgi:ketosteroid isomerase-like protein
MKHEKDPKLIVIQFNKYINIQDVEKLSELMAPDYTFIDSSGEIQVGKDRNVKNWIEFFNLFPDYINHFSKIESKGNEVLVIGHSTCSDDRLNGSAIWKVKVEKDLVTEWRVYLDTPENRKVLS